MEPQAIVPPPISDADNVAPVQNAAIQALRAEPPARLDGFTPPAGLTVKNLFEQLGAVVSDLGKFNQYRRD